MTTNRARNLQDFLKNHKYKKGVNTITHTRIPGNNVYGGSYTIMEEDKKEFYQHYYKQLWEDNKPEYLTEKQLEDEGPILVDFDFRFDSSIKKRQHTNNHIIDMIDLYLDEIKGLVNVEDNVNIPIYIFEKPNINKQAEYTKDGIHMIIGINMHHNVQCLLRDRIVKNLGDRWDDLPLTNDWASVLDEGITVGYTNWQLYGSRKPDNEAYALTGYFQATLDDDEFSLNQMQPSDFNFKENMMQLSAQYSKHNTFKNLEETEVMLKKFSNKKTSKLKLKITTNDSEVTPMDKIENEQQLDTEIARWMDNIQPSDYNIKETHEFTMILPESYYGSGSYSKWIRVGWALKNTARKSSNYRDNRLFLTFLKFSSQSSEFTFSDVPGLWDQWCNKFHNKGGLTKKSIMYWARCDAPQDLYNKIRNETVDYYLEAAIKDQTEFDLANVLYQLFKDRYICVSIKNNIWYEFKDHRWLENDSGNGLRMAISKELHRVFTEKVIECTTLMKGYQPDDPNWPKMQARTHTLATIAIKLKKTTDKNNIMREARELFYDEDFLDEQDNKVYLLGFQNGIYDFEEKRFRPGRPEDYVVKSTKIDYVPIEKIKKKHIDEINTFMEQLFPAPELRQYMWQHLASTLLGTIENQTFNIYNGSGRNGKSVLVTLMSKVLGDYKGTVPITLITSKRNNIGSTSSEVVALKGTRYAVMQEPSKGDKINEGIMKEITGGDPIQGRALFKDSVTFIPQFKLVVCTNTLFEIKSNDDGTWRRIRVVEFQSKFKENPVSDDPDEPYQFKVDKKLEEKFDDWKTAMMSMLIEVVKKTQGNVEDCKMVMAKSNEYRDGQDYLAEFVKEKIIENAEGKIKKQELYNEFKEWYTLQHGRNIPKGRELYQFMDKKFGRYKNGWHGVEVQYDMEEEEF